MAFSTLSFLFFFLPVVMFLYFIVKNRTYRNIILLICSLFFYSFGEPVYILLMLAVSAVAYVGGLMIFRFGESGKNKARKAVFVITLATIIANLIIFKYLNLITDGVCLIIGRDTPLTQIALPIGISFYTFQISSYVIDLYRGEIALQKNYFYLTLYLSFFPQLIAGPIVRYQTVEDEINNRVESLEGATVGIRRFIVGLAKKVIIANAMGGLATSIYTYQGSYAGTSMLWLAAIAYTLQIYFDFSGYSDMAIGLGRVFGFNFLENFNYPYISTSITEFWRRWHISLSTWFRDYVYIPLGGNRVGKARWILNLFIVWGLTGFWHGAKLNFLCWGLYYGLLLLVEKLLLGKLLARLPKIAGWIYTMLFVIIGWVFFNLTDFSVMADALKGMFVFRKTEYFSLFAADTSIMYNALYVPLGVLCMFPWTKWIKLPRNALTDTLLNVLCIGLFGICVAFIIGASYNPFIYFRF